jgi:hypothetical protein
MLPPPPPIFLPSSKTYKLDPILSEFFISYIFCIFKQYLARSLLYSHCGYGSSVSRTMHMFWLPMKHQHVFTIKSSL